MPVLKCFFRAERLDAGFRTMYQDLPTLSKIEKLLLLAISNFLKM